MPDYLDRHERRLVTTSIVIGIVVWALVYTLKTAVHWLFHENMHWVEHGPLLFGSVPWLVFIPLLGGALIVAALVGYRSSTVHYRDDNEHIHELLDIEGDGLERTIALYYASEPALEQTLLGKEGVDVRWELPTLSLALRKMAATLITLGSGGSGGLEASVVLIGESTAVSLFKPRPFLERLEEKYGYSIIGGLLSKFWQWWRSSRTDTLQTAQLGGVAAAGSTLLGAPLAAAFFATEVMYRRRPIIEKLLYALIAALTAYFLSNFVSNGHSTLFEVEHLQIPPLTWHYYIAIVIMAVAVSLFDAYFGRIRASFADAFHRVIPNIWLRHLTGAAITGTIALSAVAIAGHEFGLELVLGPGESIIDAALMGTLTLRIAFIALIAKLFATLATIGSGGSAGLLVPAIFFGTMIGSIIATIFGYPAMMLVIPAMTASLVSIVNVPLAAILLVVTLVITLLMAHENSIYRTQREEDDKREILPGYSVRRIIIPQAWSGRTLSQLELRARFDINVIGMITASPGGSFSQANVQAEQAHIRPHVSVVEPLQAGDLLIVLGEDEKLVLFEERLQALVAGDD